MGLVTFVLTLPFAPVRGVLAVGEIIRRQVEQEMYGSVTIRARLEELQSRRARGLISEEEKEQAEQQILDQLMVGRRVGDG